MKSMFWVDDSIMKRWNKFTLKFYLKKNEILTKELAATYRVKNTSLMNDELIQKCYDSQTDKHFEVKRIENFVQWRCNISNFKN